MGASELEFVSAGTIDKVATDMAVERDFEYLEEVEVEVDPSLQS